MAKRKWDLRSALNVCRDADSKRKLIKMDGKAGLTECGAMDYLKNNHGYRLL